MEPTLLVSRPAVLFVDDEQRVLDGLRRSMFSARDRWDVRTACGGRAALSMLEERAVSVVISDLRMPGMDGLTFLQEVAERWPESVRIILSGQEDADTGMRAWQIAHQYLSKPCEGRAVLSALDRAVSVHRLLQSSAMRAMAGRLRTLPTTPGILAQIEQIGAKDGVPMADVVRIIERDVALTGKVLQLVNSAYFGVTRSIANVESAIQVMGVDLLRALIYAHEIGHAFPSTLSGWSPQAEQHQTLRVAAVAKALGDSRAEAADLFTAGILHDVGKLVLASRAPELLEQCITMAEEQAIPLFAAERALCGVTHAEVGAYLIGLWGLPWPLVEAVALQPTPLAWPGAGNTLAAKVGLAIRILHDHDAANPERVGSAVSRRVATAAWTDFSVLGDAASVDALRVRGLAAVPATDTQS